MFSTGNWEGISLLLTDCCRLLETSFSKGATVVVVVVLVVVVVDVLAVLLLLLLLLDPSVVVVRSVDFVPVPIDRTSLKVRLLERTLSTMDGCSWPSPKSNPSPPIKGCDSGGGPLMPFNAAVDVLTIFAIDIWF